MDANPEEAVPPNPYKTMQLDETEGVHNFDMSILIKGMDELIHSRVVNNLNAYSVDPTYVSPEEHVMRNMLASENPSISWILECPFPSPSEGGFRVYDLVEKALLGGRCSVHVTSRRCILDL